MNRRKFLQTATATVGAIALPSFNAPAMSLIPRQIDAGKDVHLAMKYAPIINGKISHSIRRIDLDAGYFDAFVNTREFNFRLFVRINCKDLSIIPVGHAGKYELLPAIRMEKAWNLVIPDGYGVGSEYGMRTVYFDNKECVIELVNNGK